MTDRSSFSFAKYAAQEGAFDEHINASIPNLDGLRADCVSLSQFFIQKRTKVVDIGCSSGALLRQVRDFNQERYGSAKYVGLDIEGGFTKEWAKHRQEASNIQFKVQDARTYDYRNASLVYSIFTLQFLLERDRVPLVKRIYEGLVDGGALILAEKVVAKNAKFQDMLSTIYHSYKLKHFTAEEVMKKQRDIVDQMKPWSEFKNFEMLRSAGFVSINTQLFWRRHLFLGIVAYKPAPFR